MWAGGRLRMREGGLRVGQTAEKITEEAAPQEKRSGSVGRFRLVQLHHRYLVGDQCLLDEVQNLVYHTGGAERPLRRHPDTSAAAWQDEVDSDEVMLMRYSALLGNSHRIHFDHKYATEVEGYPSVVVHGPLLATWIFNSAAQRRPNATQLTYRAVAPAFVNEHLLVKGNSDCTEAWIERKTDQAMLMKCAFEY